MHPVRRLEDYMLRKLLFITVFIMAAAAMSLWGCDGADSKDRTVILVNKNGSITSKIAESFEEAYYRQEELKAMIESEAAEYNAIKGETSIRVEKVKVEEGMTDVVLSFANRECYADYTGSVFFAGTITEALEKGFDLNVTCYDIEDKAKTIQKSEIEQMGKSHILITDEPREISSVLEEKVLFQPVSFETFGAILYVSEGIVPEKNKNSVRIEARTGKLSYIIFK